jgi:hypothetical protein
LPGTRLAPARSLPRAAGAPDVVPQDVRVDYDRRRAQQDVLRERALGAGEADGRIRTVLVHVSDHAADEQRDVLRCAEAVLHALQVTGIDGVVFTRLRVKPRPRSPVAAMTTVACCATAPAITVASAGKAMANAVQAA